jgi:hypothetical protein
MRDKTNYHVTYDEGYWSLSVDGQVVATTDQDMDGNQAYRWAVSQVPTWDWYHSYQLTDYRDPDPPFFPPDLDTDSDPDVHDHHVTRAGWEPARASAGSGVWTRVVVGAVIAGLAYLAGLVILTGYPHGW